MTGTPSRTAHRRKGQPVVAPPTEGWLHLGPVTIALTMLNVIGFLAVTAEADMVEALGQQDGWDGLAQQPWTAFTVMFTSGHVAHLLLAAAVIVVAGGALERRVGSVQTLGTYLLAGLAASMAVATVISAGAETSGVSLGASGAFLGLVGALAAMPASTSAIARLQLPKIVAVVVFLNLAQPLVGMGEWTSAVAHLTGLGVGAIVARTRVRQSAPA